MNGFIYILGALITATAVYFSNREKKVSQNSEVLNTGEDAKKTAIKPVINKPAPVNKFIISPEKKRASVVIRRENPRVQPYSPEQKQSDLVRLSGTQLQRDLLVRTQKNKRQWLRKI